MAPNVRPDVVRYVADFAIVIQGVPDTADQTHNVNRQRRNREKVGFLKRRGNVT